MERAQIYTPVTLPNPLIVKKLGVFIYCLFFRFTIWKTAFYLSRIGTMILAGLTFTVGLGSLENKGIDVSAGNFNSFVIR